MCIRDSLNDFNTEQVTNMDNMFRGCSSVTNFDLMSFNTEKVTSMTNLFIGCSNLTSINFGDNFNTSQVIMMNNMFKAVSYTHLTFPNPAYIKSSSFNC